MLSSLDDRWKGCTGHTWKVSKGGFMMFWWMVRDTKGSKWFLPLCVAQVSKAMSQLLLPKKPRGTAYLVRHFVDLCWCWGTVDHLIVLSVLIVSFKRRAFQNVLRTLWKRQERNLGTTQSQPKLVSVVEPYFQKDVLVFLVPAELVDNCMHGSQHRTIIVIPFYAVHDLQEYLRRSQAC